MRRWVGQGGEEGRGMGAGERREQEREEEEGMGERDGGRMARRESHGNDGEMWGIGVCRRREENGRESRRRGGGGEETGNVRIFFLSSFLSCFLFFPR